MYMPSQIIGDYPISSTPAGLPTFNTSMSSLHASATSGSAESVLSSSLPSYNNYYAPPRQDCVTPDHHIDRELDLELDDDFFDLSRQEQKGRSRSFGGMTQYSQQYARTPAFAPSLRPISDQYITNDLYDSCENLGGGRLGASSAASQTLLHSPDGTQTFSPGYSMGSPGMNGVVPSGASDSSDPGCPSGSKKSTTRRNAWGNLSYADLITQAIIQSPEKRLTLSQVYEWMVQNVPYFRDKGDSNSSAGWKNSIRHNLSLHSRFMRIQNEGAGKSSWWVINPDAKPGRNPRRQRASTLDATSKAAMEKKRRVAKKRVSDLRGGLIHSGVSSLAGSQLSVMSHEVYDDDNMGSFDPFRPRTQSNMSMPGSSARVSPTMEHNNDYDYEFPSWVDSAVAIPNDILDRTDQMRIDPCRTMMNGIGGIKTEHKVIKTEPISNPSYQELNSVRGPSQLQNPLLRNQLTKFPPSNNGMSMYSPPFGGWAPPSSQHQNAHSCAAAQQQSMGTALPIDLENLTLPDQPFMDMSMDVESVLRHELSQTRDHQINFDL